MHEVKPSAMLVHEALSRREALFKIYNGYRRCYSDNDSWLITNSRAVKKEEMEAFIRKMLKAEHAHESPLEHASLSFHVTCSRACSHQLVRHRIASYSQQSQRYVRMDDLPYILPPLDYLDEDRRKELHDEYREDVAYAENAYFRKVVRGVSPEDARSVLPNMVATQVMVSMNFRSLRHFFTERCCNRAQWEIRAVAQQMLEVCRNLYPCVFEDVGPHCMKLKRCPEAKPCGKQPWRENA